MCVVLGNEAADLDSVVSAIVLARHLSVHSFCGEPNWMPVINCLRTDIVLRTEVGQVEIEARWVSSLSRCYLA